MSPMTPDIDVDTLAATVLSPPQFAALLEPLDEAQPTGEDLRYTDVYDHIAEARREDDASLPQGDWQIALKKADWSQVEQRCLDALQHRSKDVQIATWLTEAWIHLHGFIGLYLGTQLLLALCQRYWHDLYPALDADDVELRISPLVWINEKFFLVLSQVPITAPPKENRDVKPCTYREREAAWAVESGSTAEKALEEQGKVTRAQFGNSLNLTPASFFQQQWRVLQACQANFKQLTTLLDAQCGLQAPSFGKIDTQLQTIARLMQNAITDTVAPEADIVSEFETADGHLPTATPMSTASGLAPIRSRQEAYQRLAEAADYLLRTEPHSPVPYLVKRAVSWGGLSLQELLLELIHDERDLAIIYQLLDIRPPQE